MIKSMYFYISAIYNIKMIKKLGVIAGLLMLKIIGLFYYIWLGTMIFILGLVKASKGNK